MDRVIVYDGALPQATDILYSNKFGMVGQAYQNRAIFGTNTVVSGLACLPTSPTPDLHVSVGVGSIYQMDPTDGSAYGDLGTDNNNIVKQGILASPATLTITPPGTAGFSQVFLVQVALNDVDAGATVLSYYNSANPASPFSGPSNSGSSNFTTRTCPCVVALKAGSAATTGTQTTPSADVGYVGLYAITVANGQTQITSGNITQVGSAPFFTTLPSVPTGVQNGSWVYAVDGTYTTIGGATYTSAVNTLVAAPSPAVTALVAGMGFKVKAVHTNTGASSIIIVNTATGVSLGTIPIVRGNGVAVAANDIVSGGIVDLVYDGTSFQMANYLGTGANTNTVTLASIPYIADSGAANAIVATYSPAFTGYGSGGNPIAAGTVISTKLAATITGACTIAINGLTAKAVTLGDTTIPPYNMFVAGELIMLEYDGTQWQLVNTSAGMFYRKPTANYTIYVNASTGSDTLYDGTASTVGAGTSGPLKTIQKAVNVAFGYAPSQFTITIQVAAGTYNEAVSTPAYAGPNLIINGASTAGVVVNAGAGICFAVSGPNTLTVTNLTVQNDGVYPHQGFTATNGATLTTGNTASNACNIIWEAGAGFINAGAHTYNGSSAYALFYSIFGGRISPSGLHTFAVPLSLVTGSAFVSAGYMDMGAVPTWVNKSNVSGYRFNIYANGVIAFNSNNDGTGGAQSFFPGTVAGFAQSGGFYNG